MASLAPELSVVVPLFNEEENLEELYRRLSETLEDLGTTGEFVFVNDGSSDTTGRILDDLAEHDERVRVLHLSRNFGHQAALSAGIDQAVGQAVILMDGDLQDPPEMLKRFVQAWREGHEVVYAIRTQRKEGWAKRTAYACFYRLLRTVSDLDIPLDSGDFCLLDRQVVMALRRLPERQRFVRGLRAYVGFRQIGLTCERAARHRGRPKYTWRALARLALDGLVGFSSLPLSLVTWLGLVTGVAAVALTIAVLIVPNLRAETLVGWLGTLLAVLYLGALQLVSLGVIGEYLRRIFVETKARPTYIVREPSRRTMIRPRGTRGPAELVALSGGKG